MHLSYLQTCDLLKQVKYPQNVFSPTRICQPLSWAVTIFVTILSLVLYFASFVNPWRLAISHTEIFTLVILHVSKSECKHKSQVYFVTALLEHKRWLPQDFRQIQLLISEMVASSELFSSALKIISPYLSTPNRQIHLSADQKSYWRVIELFQYWLLLSPHQTQVRHTFFCRTIDWKVPHH